MKIIGKNNTPEKRRFPRDDYQVSFHYETQDIKNIGFMSNVSIGGAFFETPASLDIGQEISLNIVLPERGFTYISGNILRSESSGYGLKFQDRI